MNRSARPTGAAAGSYAPKKTWWSRAPRRPASSGISFGTVTSSWSRPWASTGSVARGPLVKSQTGFVAGEGRRRCPSRAGSRRSARRSPGSRRADSRMRRGPSSRPPDARGAPRLDPAQGRRQGPHERGVPQGRKAPPRRPPRPVRCSDDDEVPDSGSTSRGDARHPRARGPPGGAAAAPAHRTRCARARARRVNAPSRT
jgi:hypothetical protein